MSTNYNTKLFFSNKIYFRNHGLNMERCMSCISKLGAPSMSRSSTAGTPGSAQPTNWTLLNIDSTYNQQNNQKNCPSVTSGYQQTASSGLDRMSVCSSHGSFGSSSSEYSVPRLSTNLATKQTHESWYEHIPSTQQPISTKSSQQQCITSPPLRPPKQKKNNEKPPMPLPIENQLHSGTITSQPSNQRQQYVGIYENYDIPKTPIKICCHSKDTMIAPSITENYDTPKRIQEYLTKDMNSNPAHNIYGNYDMPAIVNSNRINHKKSCEIGDTNNHRNCMSTMSDTHSNGCGIDIENSRIDCTCNKVMSWADTWISLPYCRRGNGIENTAVPINKIKLNGEGKMPVVHPSGELAIYATVDVTKKIRRNLLTDSKSCECPHEKDNIDNNYMSKCCEPDSKRPNSESSNYINIAPISQPENVTQIDNSCKNESDSKTTSNYMNFGFALSLENYENAKEILHEAGYSIDDITESLQQCMPSSELCKKCGHTSKRTPNIVDENSTSKTAINPTLSETAAKVGDESEQGNQLLQPEAYMLMEPRKNNKNFAGYLPMSPATPNNITNLNEPVTDKHVIKRILSEKSASNPNLGPIVDRSKKRAEQEKRIPGSAMLLQLKTGGSPYTRKQLMDNSDLLPNDKRILGRKRSTSADYTQFVENITKNNINNPDTRQKPINAILVNATKALNQIRRASSPCLHHESEHFHDISFCENSTKSESIVKQSLAVETDDDQSLSMNQSQTSHHSVNIRRSASVPCKAQNRDSSSSNDSGVSTSSTRQRNYDFTEFELPLTTTISSMRLQRNMQHIPSTTVHGSLPRRSKSFDPLREINFQFQRNSRFTEKSTSAEAEVPICTSKQTNGTKGGYASPNDIASLTSSCQPYIDSRSTSSGTSDMSDYIETLSMSSHSSSDTPENLR